MVARLVKTIVAVYGTREKFYAVSNSSFRSSQKSTKFPTFEDALQFLQYPATGPLLNCSDSLVGSQRTVLIVRITIYSLQERTWVTHATADIYIPPRSLRS